MRGSVKLEFSQNVFPVTLLPPLLIVATRVWLIVKTSLFLFFVSFNSVLIVCDFPDTLLCVSVTVNYSRCAVRLSSPWTLYPRSPSDGRPFCSAFCPFTARRKSEIAHRVDNETSRINETTTI